MMELCLAFTSESVVSFELFPFRCYGPEIRVKVLSADARETCGRYGWQGRVRLGRSLLLVWVIKDCRYRCKRPEVL